jgi:hypothetical protein
VHQLNIKDYIIQDDDQNKSEREKINTYMNNEGLNNDTKISHSSLLRNDLERPLRRPTTPMTNLSSSSNSQMFTNGIIIY